MRHLPMVLVILLCAILARADAPPASRPAGDAAAQVAAVIAEYDKAMADFSQAYAAVKTPDEQQKVMEKYPQPALYLSRLLTIAQDNPKTPSAFDALKWIIDHDRAQTPTGAAALKIVTSDFAADPRAGEVAADLTWSASPAAEAFFQAVIAQNPDRTAKGMATFAMGRLKKSQAGDARQIQSHSVDVNADEAFLGKDVFAAMMKMDPDALTKEAELLFEKVRAEYADVKGGFHETLGKSAEAELFELRELAIGKTAPDIAGEDIAGQPMKLSDFRGKVVLLDFWGDW
ncbi:MAG TPA: hypothetical protein VLI90_12475 [Tepidisphaeraceae bacterium]|nr:hypothetical protein [Tepidisphaeraceae bacterium]